MARSETSDEEGRSLGQRLRQWIARETTGEVAEGFYPWVQKTLSGLGYDLSAPASEAAVRETKAMLRRADITPGRMARALRASRRAQKEGVSSLEWVRAVQKRAYGEEAAEEASRQARKRLKGEFGKEEADLQKPPTPTEVFAFLLAWEELGGSSALAALRETLHRTDGAPSRN